MSLALSYAATSHVGLLRTGNEDSGYSGPRLLAVADGMGGHAAGEVASAVAIARISALDEDAPGSDLLQALSSAATEANDTLRDMVAGDGALEGMGTTLTALLFSGARIGVLHIGDSRCYLLRDGELNQITRDDTLVQSLIDEGRITEDEASTHPQRSLITRALDGRPGVDFDLSVREARVGDRYLLCTDGLTGPVGRRETLHEALTIPAAADAVQRLVELALRGGGPDNVTVVVADVIDGSQADPPLVVGAAADEASAGPTVHLDTGAAGRAAAITAPAPVAEAAAEPDPEPEPPRRRGRTIALVVVAVVALLGLGGAAGYAFIRSQWYVGVEDGQVTVFRGLDGSLLGIDLHSAQEPATGLLVAQLDEQAQDNVEKTYGASSKADAERYVQGLRERVTAPQPIPSLPPTPTVTPAVTPTSTPIPTATPVR
jgi:protein phosphatase